MPKKKLKPPLSKTHPQLAKQAVGWNPKSYTAGSNKKVKWKCKKGHIWQAVIVSRAIRGSGCSVCSGRTVLKGFNDLKTLYPNIAKQLIEIDPSTIFARSEKKVNWKCAKGHVWVASISNRTRLKSGCPFCAGSKVIVGKTDIKTTHPQIASEAFDWDPKNYSIGSGITLRWKCTKGHIWEAKPQKRARGDNCNICSGRRLSPGDNDLQTTDPGLASEAFGWDPKSVSKGHNRKKQWICNYGHIWSATVNSRSGGIGCPICSGKVVLKGFNDLKTLNPELSLQANGWNPELYSTGSGKLMSWKCKLGHEWKASIYNRQRTMHCPTCIGKVVLKGFNDLATTHPDLAKQAVGWDPTAFTAGSSASNKLWICDQGHKWKSKIVHRSDGSNCPTCSKSGFNPNGDAWIYLMKHEKLGYLQIGITNFPQERLKVHRKVGWEEIEIRGPMEGYLASQWETSILRMLRSKSVPMGPAKSDIDKKGISHTSKFIGTEMWLHSAFSINSIKELMRLTEEFEDSNLR